MNPLLKKEIRLLFPAWVLTVVLAVAGTFIFGSFDGSENLAGNFTPVWLGIMLLCAASFGREFSLGTFSGLLAQPFPRQQFWQVKVGVLAVALVSVLLVFSALNFSSIAGQFGWHEAAWFGLIVLAAVAGGLWMALLIRQVIAVIWMIALIPGFLCVPFLLVMSHFNAADVTVEVTLYVLLLLYSVAGIAGSWLIFRRAQDAPWSGGTIDLPEWLTASLTRSQSASERREVPWRALIHKELHFNRVLLFGMGGLFVFDLAEVFIRYLRGNNNNESDFNVLLMVAGLVFWVIAPLVIGCTSIAEERKLGTLETQLVQPVSARRQFLVKLGFVVVFGGIVSTLLPGLAELIAGFIGLEGKGELPPFNVTAGAVAGMTGLALVSFFASSLTRNVLQALPVAVGMIIGIGFTAALLAKVSGYADFTLFPGAILWSPVLAGIVLAGTLAVTLPWLAWRNFRQIHEAGRLWRRNTLGLAAALIFAMAASTMLYHRAWDKLLPLESSHGLARWNMDNRPVVVRTGLPNNLLFLLPDGRFWFGYLVEDTENPLLRGRWRTWLATPPPPALTICRTMPDSNWASFSTGYVDEWANRTPNGTTEPRHVRYAHVVSSRQAVGVRPDGTLWISERPVDSAWNDAPMVQYGADANWKAVQGQRGVGGVVLLKQDGTLWLWQRRPFHPSPAQPQWPGLQASPPVQLGRDSDWTALADMDNCLAQKKDGSFWNLIVNYEKFGSNRFILNTNLSFGPYGRPPLGDTRVVKGNFGGALASVRADGTLWIGGELYWTERDREREMMQVGQDRDWKAVALGAQSMVALKADGSLWIWGGGVSPFYQEPGVMIASPPHRLGSHHDWVAVTQTPAGIVSVAGDGSLWLWPDNSDRFTPDMLIEPSGRPLQLGNILAAK